MINRALNEVLRARLFLHNLNKTKMYVGCRLCSDKKCGHSWS